MATAILQNSRASRKFTIPAISFDPTEMYEQRYALANSFANLGFVQISKLIHEEADTKLLQEYLFIIRDMARMDQEILTALDCQGMW